MKRVIIESPFAGDLARNIAYARALMLDALKRGMAPFLSHLLYTQVLDDNDPVERALGIEAGLAWASVGEETIIGTDLGISSGMRLGTKHALDCNRLIVECKLGGEWERK